MYIIFYSIHYYEKGLSNSFFFLNNFKFKIETPYFFYVLTFHFTKSSFRASSIIILKASIIWLKNSSDPIGFPWKITESSTWHNYSYLNNNFINYFFSLSYLITLIPIPEKSYVKCWDPFIATYDFITYPLDVCLSKA